MEKFVLSIKKRFLVPTVLLTALGTWLFLCAVHYESYWQGTIYRVQTTDFNMLHHTLPVTLSQMILSGRDDLVQETLDSNFGLFGLIVTDPSGQNILYKTEKIYHRRSWQKRAQPELLSKETEPYDLLCDPPLLEPLNAHKSPRSAKAERLIAAQPAKILGRLYYLHTQAPTFSQDLGNFLLTGFWEESGAKRGYLFITLSCVGFSLVILLLVWLRKRGLELKAKELEHMRRELNIRRKALENLSSELTTQKARKVWLEREADQAYKRAVKLRENLERLRLSLQSRTDFEPDNRVKIRPPVSPPAVIFEEIESLIPALSGDAQALRSQADQLQDYCVSLEERQDEMKRIVQKAFGANAQGEINMSPH